MTTSIDISVSKRNPVVSVLMAVYNAPVGYLDAAIVSILQQSWRDFEFIIVDDASDLAIANQLQVWAARDHRIRLHSLPVNIGLTRALNEGLKFACGKYIARQDADDVSEPRRLEAQLDFLALNPQVDATGTDAVLIDVGGNKIGDMRIDPKLHGLSRRNLLVHGSMIFRRRVFDLLSGYDERMRLSQDYELYLRMRRFHGMKIGVLQEAHYRLRQHSESLSSRLMFRQLYYSVLAKTLTSPLQGQLSKTFYFARTLAFDLLVSHRLMLGPLFRRFFSGSSRHQPAVRNEMSLHYKEITACRMCGNRNLVEVIDLGQQYLTGVFPKKRVGERLTKGPLQLVKCHSETDDVCGLLQLRHSYDPDEMYGENYGYRSGLNSSMVEHLRGKIRAIIDRVELNDGDLVIDIGSNDATSLSAYPSNLTLVGVDPAGKKFQRYYPPHVVLIPELFSANLIVKRFPGKKVKVITSFSMVYDLEDPLGFAREIAGLLASDGIWVFEQSYMPLMLERMAFDTICHEHIEYYGLKQIEWMLERAGLEIVDVEFNDVNGGSFSVVAALKNADRRAADSVSTALRSEVELSVDALSTYAGFRADIENACVALKDFLAQAKRNGKRVCGLGASTKGNVLLQYCDLSSSDVEMIGEINPDKFGSVTPGTWIPIEDEAKVLASKPDYLLVLPWHFRGNFLENPAYVGQQLVFPLPYLEIVRT